MVKHNIYSYLVCIWLPCIPVTVTDTKISKKVSHSAALNVINSHRNTSNEEFLVSAELKETHQPSAISESEKDVCVEVQVKRDKYKKAEEE